MEIYKILTILLYIIWSFISIKSINKVNNEFISLVVLCYIISHFFIIAILIFRVFLCIINGFDWSFLNYKLWY